MTTALNDGTRTGAPRNLQFATMTQYDKSSTIPYVLAPEHPNNILANVMEQLNWRNLRVAETEKYAHVTYFFNGGTEKPFTGGHHSDEFRECRHGGPLREDGADNPRR